MLLGRPGPAPGVGAEDWARSGEARAGPARRAGLRMGADGKALEGPRAGRGRCGLPAQGGPRPSRRGKGLLKRGRRAPPAPNTHTLVLAPPGPAREPSSKGPAGGAHKVLGALRPLPDAARS